MGVLFSTRNQTAIGWFVAFLGWLVAIIALVPSFRSTTLAQGTYEFTKWTARKDHLENCQAELVILDPILRPLQTTLLTKYGRTQIFHHHNAKQL